MNKVEYKLNKKILDDEAAKKLILEDLSNDQALEKGIESFWEIFFYLSVFWVTYYEIYVVGQNSKEQWIKDKKEVQELQENISKCSAVIITGQNEENIRIVELEKTVQSLEARLNILESTQAEPSSSL